MTGEIQGTEYRKYQNLTQGKFKIFRECKLQEGDVNPSRNFQSARLWPDNYHLSWPGIRSWPLLPKTIDHGQPALADRRPSNGPEFSQTWLNHGSMLAQLVFKEGIFSNFFLTFNYLYFLDYLCKLPNVSICIQHNNAYVVLNVELFNVARHQWRNI